MNAHHRKKRPSSSVASTAAKKPANAKAVLSNKLNQYDGHCDAPLEVILSDVLDLSTHVATRTPVHIHGLPSHWKSKTVKELSSELRKVASESQVRVEQRADSKHQFGVGDEVYMTVRELLDRLDKEDDRVYLSAQPLQQSSEGLVKLASSPMLELIQSGHFEARPKLLASLVPANVNLWLGFARDGASSGLHHDFHDNLYVLVSGEKEFLLVDPSHAEKLYTHGKIARVHANGIINYAGAETRSDGATPFQVRRFEHRSKLRKLEQTLDAAERDLANGVKGAKQRVAKAQRALIAHAPVMQDDDDDDNNDENNEEDDDDDDDDEGLFGGADNDALFDEHDEPDSFDDEAAFGADARDDFDETEFAELAPEAQEEPSGRDWPPSFSRIADPVSFDATKFPLFVDVPVHRVTLKAGDMLYLPAGWFHCVKSRGGLHCAVNYWFNVPPYQDKLFDDEWLERIHSNEVH